MSCILSQVVLKPAVPSMTKCMQGLGRRSAVVVKLRDCAQIAVREPAHARKSWLSMSALRNA